MMNGPARLPENHSIPCQKIGVWFFWSPSTRSCKIYRLLYVWYLLRSRVRQGKAASKQASEQGTANYLEITNLGRLSVFTLYAILWLTIHRRNHPRKPLEFDKPSPYGVHYYGLVTGRCGKADESPVLYVCCWSTPKGCLRVRNGETKTATTMTIIILLSRFLRPWCLPCWLRLVKFVVIVSWLMVGCSWRIQTPR